MANFNNKIQILLSSIILSFSAQAQTTNKELYKEWKTTAETQEKENKDIIMQQKRTDQSDRKDITIESVLSGMPIMPVTMDDLRKYNVVAISYELLENAQRQCKKLH